MVLGYFKITEEEMMLMLQPLRGLSTEFGSEAIVSSNLFVGTADQQRACFGE